MKQFANKVISPLTYFYYIIKAHLTFIFNGISDSMETEKKMVQLRDGDLGYFFIPGITGDIYRAVFWMGFFVMAVICGGISMGIGLTMMAMGVCAPVTAILKAYFTIKHMHRLEREDEIESVLLRVGCH